MVIIKILTVLLVVNQAGAGLFGRITYPPNWTSEWGIRHGYGPSTTTPSTTTAHSSTLTTPETTTTLPYKGKGKGVGKSSQKVEMTHKQQGCQREVTPLKNYMTNAQKGLGLIAQHMQKRETRNQAPRERETRGQKGLA